MQEPTNEIRPREEQVCGGNESEEDSKLRSNHFVFAHTLLHSDCLHAMTIGAASTGHSVVVAGILCFTPTKQTPGNEDAEYKDETVRNDCEQYRVDGM